jgi:hypothetical protein
VETSCERGVSTKRDTKSLSSTAGTIHKDDGSVRGRGVVEKYRARRVDRADDSFPSPEDHLGQVDDDRDEDSGEQEPEGAT